MSKPPRSTGRDVGDSVPDSARVPAAGVLAQYAQLWRASGDRRDPLVHLHRPAQYALQSQQGGTEWNMLMAASLLVMLPVIVLFFLAQKTFIQGIATTGMK